MPRLAGKIALVTGASGIGEGIARAFVGEGAVVFLSDVADERGERVAREIGGGAGYGRLDVRSEADWVRFVDSVLDAHGRLDVVVNNAGITGFEGMPALHDPERCRLEDWHAVLATNLDGVFLGCKHAIGAMKIHGTGSIINMSSRSGLVGIPGASAYAASKAAVRNHTKTVALYCAEKGWKIRCNSIQPGSHHDTHVGTGAGDGREAGTAHRGSGSEYSAGPVWRSGRNRGARGYAGFR